MSLNAKLGTPITRLAVTSSMSANSFTSDAWSLIAALPLPSSVTL